MTVEEIARITHEVNRAWCEFNGDHSQPKWDDAPQWQRDSAMSGVRFHQANPNAGDSASHDEWLRHKKAEGWVYGPVKDPEAKQHPCMVPFEAAPAGAAVQGPTVPHDCARERLASRAGLMLKTIFLPWLVIAEMKKQLAEHRADANGKVGRDAKGRFVSVKG